MWIVTENPWYVLFIASLVSYLVSKQYGYIRIQKGKGGKECLKKSICLSVYICRKHLLSAVPPTTSLTILSFADDGILLGDGFCHLVSTEEKEWRRRSRKTTTTTKIKGKETERARARKREKEFAMYHQLSLLAKMIRINLCLFRCRCWDNCWCYYRKE